MAQTHQTMSITSSEIRGVVNDTKVFSLKPSGLVGVSPIATGTFSMGAGCLAAQADLTYSIYALGNLYYLVLSNMPATATNDVADGLGGHEPEALKGGVIPRAYWPSADVTTMLSVTHGAYAQHVAYAVLNNTGTMFIYPADISYPKLGVGWVQDGNNISFDGFVLPYAK